MVNKTALRMISRFRDLLELAKTEFVCIITVLGFYCISDIISVDRKR